MTSSSWKYPLLQSISIPNRSRHRLKKWWFISLMSLCYIGMPTGTKPGKYKCTCISWEMEWLTNWNKRYLPKCLVCFCVVLDIRLFSRFDESRLKLVYEDRIDLKPSRSWKINYKTPSIFKVCTSFCNISQVVVESRKLNWLKMKKIDCWRNKSFLYNKISPLDVAFDTIWFKYRFCFIFRILLRHEKCYNIMSGTWNWIFPKLLPKIRSRNKQDKTSCLCGEDWWLNLVVLPWIHVYTRYAPYTLQTKVKIYRTRFNTKFDLKDMGVITTNILNAMVIALHTSFGIYCGETTSNGLGYSM